MFQSHYIAPTLLKIFNKGYATLALKLDKQHGFVTNEDISNLTNIDPKLLVLVRCGNGRFTIPLANLNDVVAQIDAKTHKQYDYVRDISIPVSLT